MRSRIRTTKVYLSDIDEVVCRGELSGRLGVHVAGNGEMGGKERDGGGCVETRETRKGSVGSGRYKSNVTTDITQTLEEAIPHPYPDRTQKRRWLLFSSGPKTLTLRRVFTF